MDSESADSKVYYIWHGLSEPREKAYLRPCAPSEDSDQPAHSSSLIRMYILRMLDSQGCKVSSCEQRRLRSDCANAQSDLSLRWAHMWGGTFSHVVAHLVTYQHATHLEPACQLQGSSAFHRNFAATLEKTAIIAYTDNKSSDRKVWPRHWMPCYKIIGYCMT